MRQFDDVATDIYGIRCVGMLIITSLGLLATMYLGRGGGGGGRAGGMGRLQPREVPSLTQGYPALRGRARTQALTLVGVCLGLSLQPPSVKMRPLLFILSLFIPLCRSPPPHGAAVALALYLYISWPCLVPYLAVKLRGGCSSNFSQYLGHSWAQSRSSLTGARNMEMNQT